MTPNQTRSANLPTPPQLCVDIICEWSCVVLVLRHSVISDSLQLHGLQPARLLCPWDSPGKNTRVGYHVLLQGIFPTQGSNLGLLHCKQILYLLSYQGSLWVTIEESKIITQLIHRFINIKDTYYFKLLSFGGAWYIANWYRLFSWVDF